MLGNGHTFQKTLLILSKYLIEAVAGMRSYLSDLEGDQVKDCALESALEALRIIDWMHGLAVALKYISACAGNLLWRTFQLRINLAGIADICDQNMPDFHIPFHRLSW